ENIQRNPSGVCSLKHSLGLLTAAPIVSPMDVPSFVNSAMDGYALSYDGKESEWQITAVGQAGDTAVVPLQTWQTARLFTRARIPEGADTVIPQELIELDQDKKVVCYNGEKINKGSNVRLRGGQCSKGDLLVEKGSKITPGVIGLLASVGIAEISVYEPLSVACIITGNELKEVGEELMEGEIYNSNGPMLEACLQQLGIRNSVILRAPDEKAKIGRAHV